MSVVATLATLTETATSLPSYNQDYINLGTLCFKATGSGVNNWVGPIPGTTVARPAQQTVAMPGFMPSVYRWSSTVDWVFFADNAAAAATRRFQLWEYTRSATPTFTYRGTITATFPTATNYTIRGFVASVYTHSTGTVAVSGTAVTGTSTQFSTDRIAVGARIGFGSTDPNQITTWYNITAIGSDTGITLNTSAGTIGSGTAYVIEEIRLNIATTNATATNGGLCVIKGLNYSTFTDAGTNIASAVSTDNVRATYWLADASTVTNTVAGGLALDTQASNTQHDAYVVNGTTSLIIYKYNLRAALTVATGKSTNAFTLATATQAVTGTAQQVNGLELATTASGTGSGTKSLFLTTSTRIYRTAVSNITSGNASWQSDNIIEQPTGTSSTIPLSASMREINYSVTLDRFYVTTNGLQTYILQYDTASTQWQVTFGINNFAVHPNAVDSNAPYIPSVTSLPWSSGNAGGILYLCRNTTTVTSNQCYALPVGADWNFSTYDTVFPRIATPNCSKFYRVFVNSERLLGGDVLGTAPEPFRISYRTSGISDNSGSWTTVADDGDLSGLGAASYIQFRAEYRVAGNTMLPNRLYGLTVVYESSDNLPGFLEWNINDSSTSDGTLGFTQTALYGSTFNLTINYYREDTDANVLSQTSPGTTNGVFEYWNGSTWVAGLTTDTVGQRRRFRPTAGLPSGVNVYAKIQVA